MRRDKDHIKIERLLQRAVRAAKKNPAATKSSEGRNMIGEADDTTNAGDMTQKSPATTSGVQYAFGVTQDDINRYVDKAYTKGNDKDYKKYAEVSDRLFTDVAGEVNIKGYAHALRDNDIRHIWISHGEQTNEKYPVTKSDIKIIPYIIANYDKIYVVKRADGRTGIVYVKAFSEGLIYYLEQVTSKYGNEKLLVNKQMIKTGHGDIPDVKG